MTLDVAKMKEPRNTNRLAKVSIFLVLASLITYGASILLALVYPPLPGHYSPLTGTGGPLILLMFFVSLVMFSLSFITGFVAILLILKRRGTEKGMALALTGILLPIFIGAYHFFSTPEKIILDGQVFIVNGKPHGTYSGYREGIIVAKGDFKNGSKEGLWTFWDPQGVKISEVSYRNNLKEGMFNQWYSSTPPYEQEQGNIKYEGNYIGNQLNGTMTNYHPGGKVSCEVLLDHGAIKSTRCWNPQGEELSQSDAARAAEIKVKVAKLHFNFHERDVELSIQQILNPAP